MGSVQGFLEIALLDHTQTLCCFMRPYPRQAIGLQFDPDRDRVRLCLADLLWISLACPQAPQFVLDMVADFMGNHIGRREIAARAKPVP